MLHCLVTGATGFVGLYIVEQLVARGDHVRALCRRPSERLNQLKVETMLGDVRDPAATAAACMGVDVAFHVAGIAGIWGPWDDYYATNTLGTRHVIASCQRHGVRYLVYTSSPSVTFDGSDQLGIDESAPYSRRWLCHYSHSKALAEQEVLAAHAPPGLSTCALRPHLVWGPGDRHLIPRLLERARNGQLRRVGDGKNRVDTVFVENAAYAHLLAADALVARSGAGGRAYFISQGEPVNCWQWIDQILEMAGLSPVRRSVPLAAAWAIGGAMEAVYRLARIRNEPRMTRFLAAQLGRSHYFDIRAAKRELGYEPRVSTQEGMARLRAHLGQIAGSKEVNAQSS